ncbi:MAG: glycosyltransferase [bacterium]
MNESKKRMRIFYASDTTPNSAFQSNLWRNNLYSPLIELGHEVIEFQYDLRKTFQNLDPSIPKQRAFITKNRQKLTEELLKQIKAAHSTKNIDLFFSYFYDACILPEAIDEIRSLGIKTVNWYCNGAYQLHLVREISSHYDWCLVPEKFRLKDYISMGARPIYCQEAANSNIYKPYNLPKEFDVTFVGQAYGERPAYIKHLLDKGINIRVWGQGWKDSLTGKNLLKKSLQAILKIKNSDIKLPDKILGRVLSDTEMIKMYSRSKINLGFSSCGETHKTKKILQVRLRDFEVPMSGGFYMVEYMEELEEFFKIGKEIVCYSNPEDLAEKIKYYLSHETEREAIRKAGYERCLRDHTWHRRFEKTFEEMKLQ